MKSCISAIFVGIVLSGCSTTEPCVKNPANCVSLNDAYRDINKRSGALPPTQVGFQEKSPLAATQQYGEPVYAEGKVYRAWLAPRQQSIRQSGDQKFDAVRAGEYVFFRTDGNWSIGSLGQGARGIDFEPAKRGSPLIVPPSSSSRPTLVSILARA